MDLTTIYNNIKNGYYENNVTFEKDLKKIWENALIYNQQVYDFIYYRQPMFTKWLQKCSNMLNN